MSQPHVRSQDGTLTVLLEQAFRIREEVAAGLQSQALSRRLLESHILTITRIVQQLSLNIQTLERQIAQRDSAACGTSQVVEWLDQKNMAGIGELRGRVARCDGNMARLSAEVNSSERQVLHLQQEVAQLRAAADTKMNKLHIKLQRDLGRLEASVADVHQIQRSFIMDIQDQMGKIENQLSAKTMEILKQSDLLKKCMEQQIHDCIQTFERSTRNLQYTMKEAESGRLERLQVLETRLEQLETRQEHLKHMETRVSSVESSLHQEQQHLKHMESSLTRRVSSVESSLHQELQLLKQNYHKGFRSVHDAIESLKDISDLKHRLEIGKLQKEIEHICSKVAELKDE